jgi:membrane protein
MDFASLRERWEGSFAGELVAELVRIEILDRALALASKMFVAVIPLSIIINARVPGTDNFGDSLVNRFGLSGTGAEATRTLFATNGEIRGAVSVLGFVILLYSVFSATKGLQGVYLDVWRLPIQRLDAILRRGAWVVTFVVFTALLAPLSGFTERHHLPVAGATVALVSGAALWLWTPYLLLGRRLPWRRLIPTGLITSAGIALYSLGSAIYLPSVFTANAERYGLIGIAFSLVTWLFGYAVVVVAAAASAGTWDRHRRVSNLGG